MINNVKNKENKSPPTITIPNDILLLELAPNAKAIGNAPNDVARVVINMGLNLIAAASTAA